MSGEVKGIEKAILIAEELVVHYLGFNKGLPSKLSFMAGMMTGVATNIFTSLQAEKLEWRLGALATSFISGILFFWVATLVEEALEAGRQIAGGESRDWLTQARYEFKKKKKGPLSLVVAVLAIFATIVLLVIATLRGSHGISAYSECS